MKEGGFTTGRQTSGNESELGFYVLRLILESFQFKFCSNLDRNHLESQGSLLHGTTRACKALLDAWLLPPSPFVQLPFEQRRGAVRQEASHHRAPFHPLHLNVTMATDSALKLPKYCFFLQRGKNPLLPQQCVHLRKAEMWRQVEYSVHLILSGL